MNVRRSRFALPALLAVAAVTACAAVSPASDSTPTSDAGHGEIAGAAEVSEAPLGLMSIDADGGIGILDLLTDERREVGTTDAAPLALASDGRYGFVTTADGLEVIDSGRWSWDHGDHFHYYLADARLLGTVPGNGEATVTTGTLSTAGSTGVFFAGSGEAVLLDNAALADGELEELFRIETGADTGIVAPLAEGALVTDGDELVFHDASGAATEASTACAAASGTITTRVGIIVGCADGAVLGTWEDAAAAFERIPYPDAAQADRAQSFDGRKGRPTVAALAGDSGFWLLDTRERTWQLVPTETPLIRVSAVDDAEGHVIAVDAEGRVTVYLAETGAQVAATEPLLAEVGGTVSLTVDEQRAYVSDPVAGVVFEIDFADGARVARTLETPTSPQLVTEVGR